MRSFLLVFLNARTLQIPFFFPERDLSVFVMDKNGQEWKTSVLEKKQFFFLFDIY